MLRHDPQIKKDLRDFLYEFLYSPLREHLKLQLDELFYLNSLALKELSHHFVYKGKLYTNQERRLPIKKHRLDPSLHSKMDVYLQEVYELENDEMPYTIGYITSALNLSDSFIDYFELLPTVLHEPLQKFLDSSPCSNPSLSAETIFEFKQKNSHIIDLIKQRRALNLLF